MNITYIGTFLPAAEADALLVSLATLPWTRGTQKRGFHVGKPVPRDEVWMGPYPYMFSHRILDPVSWTSEIETLRDRIQAAHGGEYNSVLLNRYRDEDDGVGWHADDEPEMDPRHPIASVSLGASRKFKIRSNDTQKIETFLLSSGSLLIMPAGFQQRYEHNVPAVKTSVGERINLTFRRMLLRGK